MSRTALAYDSDAAQASKSKFTASGLRVNKPSDAFEVEADRVADTVSRGGRVVNWSLSRLDADGIQRDSAGAPTSVPTTAPKPNNYEEGLGKLGEAFLKTDVGKQITDAAKKDPLVKGAESFVDTLPGKIIVGAAATGAVSALAATHTPLPAQIPSIPLDSVKPGLSVKITYEGPVDRPTKATISFSYTPKSASDEKRSKQTAAEKQRKENARNANDLYKFQEGLKSPEQRKAEAEDAQHALNAWVTRPNAMTGGIDPNKYVPGASSQPAGPQLTMPAPQSSYGHKFPTLMDKKLELKPMTMPGEKPATDTKKKEEIPVQRKAQPSAEVFAGSADVESVVRSSGRPLDAATRRYMESRIGFDFSKVRVHTDERAAASARALGAQAYTVGSSVVFGAGSYAPQTTKGRRLLAHELTHVVQQSSSPQRSHPVARPAPRQVQRFWGIELPDAKAWLLGKLQKIDGYPLFCVVIGQDLITGQRVERNATNLTEGVLDLFKDGKALFEKLKKAASAIETAYHWVLDQITELGLTEDYFSKLLDRALGAVELTHPVDSWNRVTAILKEPLDKLIELASRMGKAVLDFILEGVLEAFPAGKKVYGILKKAGAVISRIAADPVSFAKNLFAAVQEGFSNFGKNIISHLGNGLKKWIFEEIGLPGLKIPDKFDFASILHMVLEVLKLTYEQRRPQLVEKLGEQVVYFFETAGNVLTRIKKEGFTAIWEMIKEKASNLFDSVIEQARNWVVSQIVKLGLAQVAALATPIGDAIEIIASIYETIKFFIEKATKFIELIDSIVNSFSDMVDGKIDAAATKVENTLADSIPLILRFLAGLLHLEGIGESIRKIIDGIRKPIDDAIGKVLDFIVDKAKPIWEKGKEAFLEHLSNIKEWWNKPRKFSHDGEDHTLTLEGDPSHPEVVVHSKDTPLGQYLDDVHATPSQKTAIKAVAKKLKWKKGEVQKPDSSDEAGNSNFNELKNLMENLDSVKERPKSVPIYGDLNVFQCGFEASAFLSSNHDPGTKPDKSDPSIMKALGPLRKKDSYIKGHLLSMRLGGKGEWNNMMPITNKANQQMEAAVEGKLIAAIGKGKNFYYYTVKGEYENTPLPENPTPQDAKSRLKKLSWTVLPAVVDPNTKQLKKVEGEKPRDQNGEIMTFSRESVDPTVTS